MRDRLRALGSGGVLLALISTLGAAAPPAAPQSAQTFTGVITDDVCARADHSRMRMGPTDAECVVACIDFHGAQYVLFDGTIAYTLSDQTTPEKFAARRVTVTGTLDPKTNRIAVDSMVATEH